MKKILILILSTLFILSITTGCSNKSDNQAYTDSSFETIDEEAIEESTSSEDSSAETIQGVLCEAERFTIIAPEGWKILELTAAGGFQLYKSSGEVIQIQYTGINQHDEAAKNEIIYFAESKDGTDPVEIQMLGKDFWTTDYLYNGENQTMYARMEDGVKLTIQTAKGNYDNNEEFKAILDTIVFK
ncbi:MAG: hypothetical protein GX675_03570 [Erysipelotrichaceae bacterium]|nr:hypothetical protein [Erysipelotrichaceae bacterium]